MLLGESWIRELRDKVVIDLGCGEGDEAIDLARRGVAKIIGIDIREPALGRARLKAAQLLGLEGVCQFALSTGEKADAVFDITMSITVHGYGELLDALRFGMREMIGGALFLRSVSRHGRSQMMLQCPRGQWSKLEYAPLGIDPARFAPRPFRSRHRCGVCSPSAGCLQKRVTGCFWRSWRD